MKSLLGRTKPSTGPHLARWRRVVCCSPRLNL